MTNAPDTPPTHYICGNCGVDFPIARWCPNCHALASEAILVKGSDTTEASTSGLKDGDKWSRWQAGTTTFGPIGRIIATLLIAGLGFLVYYFVRTIPGPGLAEYVFLAPYVVIAFMALKGIWALDRVVPKRRRHEAG